MNRFFVELQDEEKACGAYCIYMILKYHGLNIELKDIKQHTRMDSNGISMRGLLECLKYYQVEAKAYEASLDDIEQNVQLPCILHFLYGEEGHYVVLYEIKHNQYIIGDPKKGLVTMYREEIEKLYTQAMISIFHIGRINTKENTYIHFLSQHFITYRYEVLQFLLRGIGISLLSFLGSLFFEIIIDDLNNNTPFFYMIVLSLSYFIIQFIKIINEKRQSLNLIGMNRILDEDYVLESYKNLNHLPMHFYNQESGYIHSQLLSLYDLSEMTLRLFESVLLNGLTIILFMIIILIINPILFLIVSTMFISIIGYIYYKIPLFKRLSNEYLESYYIHHNDVLENINNIFLMKRFHYKNNYNTHYTEHALKKQEKNNEITIMNSIISHLIQFFFTLLLIYGLYSYSINTLSLGNLIMITMLISQILPSFISLVSLFFEYHTMKLLYERYKNFKYEKVEKEEVKESITFIRIDDLSFSYGYRENLFEHIDLLINKSISIKGSSGSGKSTLLNLIMGHDLNYNGHIYINNQELKEIDLNSLYKHIGYENQTPQFFHGTLYDNLLCDDDELIMSLLKGFGCEELESFLYLTIDCDGSPLSSGQRQIFALIRLFTKDYDVYILDEVFTHLDNKRAGKIYRYINKVYSDKILIMVNHQNNLVNKNHDCVIIENGKLTEKG